MQLPEAVKPIRASVELPGSKRVYGITSRFDRSAGAIIKLLTTGRQLTPSRTTIQQYTRDTDGGRWYSEVVSFLLGGQPGFSGAPIFDRKTHQAVAIYASKDGDHESRGTPFKLILDDVAAKLHQVPTPAAAAVKGWLASLRVR